ncbi:hypothetical protein H2200_013001 [Cladophialophora chaetospira]|uniref:Mucin-7 n=1 Tax=Cladophialophora chaetospira TaxID=386627 RepID=A0AA38WWI9_9EURO|nr:hypothetical protein H2200_013001 [Cladophialophora chaetospira]
MSANSVNNGVRNLRAMFENKGGDQSTSPPSRGRSPNPSEFSNGSRPVSKVRASFVAVERPGENGGPAILGLRRASEVSSMGGIQEHAVVDNEPTEKPPVTKQAAAKDITPPVTEAKRPVDDVSEEGGLGKILKGSAFVENTPSKAPADVTNLGHALTSGQLQQKTPNTTPSKPKDQSNAAAMMEKLQGAKETKPGPPPSTTLKTTATAQPVKAPPTRQINSKAVPKSPIVTQPSPRTPTSPKMNIKGGPAKIRGVIESAKEAQKAREAAKEQSDKQDKSQPSVPKVDTQSKSKPAPVTAKKDSLPTSPKSVRSPKTVKPKPPTVPGKLPAVATATTTSAAAKHDVQRSPTDSMHKPAAKKPSTLSMRPPRISTSSTTSSLAKKASRASLTNGHERPQSRASTTKPDDGFLARMMRPTASSAQKTHDKVVTPPKTKTKTVAPPKAKHTTTQEPPPKMQLNVPKVSETENEENQKHQQENQDQMTLPDVAHPSPFDAMKQDPLNVDTSNESRNTEPAVTAEQEQVNGGVQEVY